MERVWWSWPRPGMTVLFPSPRTGADPWKLLFQTFKQSGSLLPWKGWRRKSEAWQACQGALAGSPRVHPPQQLKMGSGLVKLLACRWGWSPPPVTITSAWGRYACLANELHPTCHASGWWRWWTRQNWPRGPWVKNLSHGDWTSINLETAWNQHYINLSSHPLFYSILVQWVLHIGLDTMTHIVASLSHQELCKPGVLLKSSWEVSLDHDSWGKFIPHHLGHVMTLHASLQFSCDGLKLSCSSANLHSFRMKNIAGRLAKTSGFLLNSTFFSSLWIHHLTITALACLSWILKEFRDSSLLIFWDGLQMTTRSYYLSMLQTCRSTSGEIS